MKSINASIIHKLKGSFTTEEILIDDPRDYEVLIDVKASGLCHSDLHVVHEGYGYPFPTVLGHEIAGIVEAIGNKVTEFKVGNHVAASLIQFCGVCENCLSQKTYLCLDPNATLRQEGSPPRITDKKGKPINQAYGISGFAEKSLVHQNQLVKIPKEIPFDKACILGCGTITGAGAIINSAQIRPGDSVAIIGVGGVGLNAISGARITGATTIIAIDLQDDKLAIAKKFGATHLINSSNEDPIKKVREITDGGVTASFEFIGLTKTAEQAFEMIKKGGGAYLIGLQKPNELIKVPGIEGLILQNKRLEGVWMGSTNIKKDIPMYAQLYLDGRLNLDDLVSKTISLNEVQAAYDELEKGEVIGRMVIVFD